MSGLILSKSRRSVLQVRLGFPGVLRGGIAFPLDVVSSPALTVSVVEDGFHLELLLIVDEVWWGSYEVWTVRFGFGVGGEETRMEDRVDFPGFGQAESVSDRS